MAGKINAHLNEDSSVTTYVVEGKVSVEHLITTIEVFHCSKPTKYVLWDFSATHVNHLQTFEIQRIASVINNFSSNGSVEKTALVFSSDVDFGLGRMLEALAQTEKMPQEIMSFRNLNAAHQWLDLE